MSYELHHNCTNCTKDYTRVRRTTQNHGTKYKINNRIPNTCY